MRSKSRSERVVGSAMLFERNEWVDCMLEHCWMYRSNNKDLWRGPETVEQLYPSVHLSAASLVVLVITPSCHAFVDWITCPIDCYYCNLRHLGKSVKCECIQ
ncbi:unnamed protein product, partial [Wuchereria bancrofti]